MTAAREPPQFTTDVLDFAFSADVRTLGLSDCRHAERQSVTPAVFAYDTAAGSEEGTHLLRAERAYCVMRRAGSKLHVSDTDTEVLVRAEGLFKVFGRRTHDAVEKLRRGTPRDEIDGVTAAVIDASFEVHRGEIFVVMGLSGSGKSTLIRMINGLHDATAGSLTILGDDITKISDKKLREIRRDR